MDVDLTPCGPHRALDIVNELRAQGYYVDRDYTWKYIPPSMHNWFEYPDDRPPPMVVFSFKDSSAASWFVLKYRTKNNE